MRREVDRAIDQRRLDAPDRHNHPSSPNLETAPGAVDDALERADLNPADLPLEGVGAIPLLPEPGGRDALRRVLSQLLAPSSPGYFAV